jgi:hypothetical protein
VEVDHGKPIRRANRSGGWSFDRLTVDGCSVDR